MKFNIPLPLKEPRRLIQAEIRTDLADAVSEEARKGNLKFRELLEWSFSNYLFSVNPKRAKELGIKPA